MKQDTALSIVLSLDSEEDEGDKSLLRKVSTKKQVKSKVSLVDLCYKQNWLKIGSNTRG